MGAPMGAERMVEVVESIKIVLHTINIDPEFFKKCVTIALREGTPGFGCQLEQHEEEFKGLLSHVKGCISALEIGSRYGRSIQRIAAEMQRGSKIVAVDWPLDDSTGLEDPQPILRKTMAEIAAEGYHVELFIGNSHDPALVAAVQALGPYDFCFIDGDHSYEGVKADWENFGPHARIVAFHDIINNKGCFRLWNEIKNSYRHVEYTQSTWLGIGILFKEPVTN